MRLPCLGYRGNERLERAGAPKRLNPAFSANMKIVVIRGTRATRFKPV